MNYFEQIFEQKVKDKKVYSTKLEKYLKFSTLKRKYEEEINSVKSYFKIVERRDANEKNKFYTELLCKIKSDEFHEGMFKDFLLFKKFFEGFRNVKIFMGLNWSTQTEFNNYYLNDLVKRENYLRMKENTTKGMVIIFSDIFEEEN